MEFCRLNDTLCSCNRKFKMIKFKSLIKPSDNSMSIKIIWKMKKDSLGVKDRSISSSVSRGLDSNVIQLQVSLISLW